MNILSATQIRDWDAYTIQHEPISSIDLMERAAKACVNWILQQSWTNKSFFIFCGKGNNGGDGLAIARMLLQENFNVAVYIPDSGNQGSENFKINLERLDAVKQVAHLIQSKDDLPAIHSDDIIIDALFGSGLNKPIEGLYATAVQHMNQSDNIISIDLPSGLFTDASSKSNLVIKARHTLSFECYKLALLIQENAEYIGEVHILPIGLNPAFISTIHQSYKWISHDYIKKIFSPRDPFAHKGKFGHGLLIAGSYGKMGAAILSARACLRSGIGLLSLHIPACGYAIMQTAVPEAMVYTDENEKLVGQLPGGIENYSIVGIGPGIGTAGETQHLVSFVCKRYNKPLVIDADGLNCISLQPELLKMLPENSVLTPHPKEFDRLFGEHQNDFERLFTANKKAVELKIVIVLKGHHTQIALPGGEVWFNSTGNAGMAKGGSGDVLTGIICSLLAQGYPANHAVLFAVFVHGLAGDYAATHMSQEAMIASDIIDHLPLAFLSLTTIQSP